MKKQLPRIVGVLVLASMASGVSAECVVCKTYVGVPTYEYTVQQRDPKSLQTYGLQTDRYGSVMPIEKRESSHMALPDGLMSDAARFLGYSEQKEGCSIRPSSEGVTFNCLQKR